MKAFQVVVGNIGRVCDSSNFMVAQTTYSRYVKQSKDGIGRAAGEPVTMFHKGEIRCEYFGTLENQD